MRKRNERRVSLDSRGNPRLRKIAAQLVGDVMKSFGYCDPASMGDLFLQVMQESSGAKEDIAFERVRMRSVAAEKKLLAEEGGSLSDAKFAEKLGVRSRTTVKNFREQGKILAIPRGSRNLRYPAWQIYKKDFLPGLEETIHVLVKHKLDPFSIALFFLTRAEALADERPLDLLRRNEVSTVIAHAQHYARRE